MAGLIKSLNITDAILSGFTVYNIITVMTTRPTTRAAPNEVATISTGFVDSFESAAEPK